MITHTFRQSQLNTWLMCPEQYRLDQAGELPRQETEATAVGTAVHAAIETVLRGDCDVDAGHDAAMDAWDTIKPTIDKWIKASPELCATHVSNCYTSWADTIYPGLPEITMVEAKFEVELYRDDYRTINLSGTVDAVDADGCVWDWKTAGRAYEQWEADRFKVQPTCYTFAAHHAWGIDNPEFAYAVMVKRSTPPEGQIVRVQRDARHWAWLQKQALSLAFTIEADLPVWQLNDQGWWCSDRWCGAWDRCKGAHVDL